MGVSVEFNQAAFRHNISKEDILHAIRNKIRAGAIDGFLEKYVIIGPDRTGNPIEVMYNPIDNDHINVFHAMKVRKSMIKILGL